MASFSKVNDFVVNAVHDMDLASDTFAIALSNTAPSAETNDPSTDGNGILTNVTEIDYTNASSRTITTTSSTQTGGVYKLILGDLTITASGGTIGPFRYIYLYNDTVTDDPLMGYYDYGSSITINDGGSFKFDFSDTNGVIQLT